MPNITSKIISPEDFVENKPAKQSSWLKKTMVGLLKLVLYVAFVAAAIYYSPKILSSALHTPYPLATITSGSMWPVLQVNDLILMKGITGNQAQIGQIIVYQNSVTQAGGITSGAAGDNSQFAVKTAGGFTIHRLIREEGGMLITKGDANDIEDVPVSPSQVVGRVVYIGSKPVRIPYLGFLAKNLGPKIQEIEKQ